MTGNSFLTRMPAGIPGAISRNQMAQVEPQQFDPDHVFIAYGRAVKLSASELIQPIGAGDTAADVYGVLVRPYPLQITSNSDQALGAGTPPTSGINDVIVAGYISVQLYGATAAKRGGQVYIRIANAGAGEVVGGFEAAADGGDTITPNGWTFMGPADADGMTEIRINVRVS